MTKALGHIKAARLDSPRLQRVLALLKDGKPHTTRQIVRQARVMAVNAAVSELRHHGAEIACVKQAAPGGQGWRFYYTMTKAPKT
jgi:nitric oxide reductase activation protein